MKTIQLLTLSLLLAFTPVLRADRPAGKSQYLTSPEQVPDGLAISDWASIRAAYEAGRHAFAPVEGGWQARNPGQHWLMKFDGRGFVAEPSGGGWQWGLEMKSYGFPGRERAIAAMPAVKAEGQRLTYGWDATVEEWFVNGARGLEHGFTVRERPAAGADAATPLQFDIAVRGSLVAQVGADGLAVAFRDATGATVLNYSGLKVWDADGKVLSARFAPTVGSASGALRLLVEERRARYPITVDPIAQQAYLKASNTGANDLFGWSVAVSGDTVVVGAIGESGSGTGVDPADNNLAYFAGAAYVFVRSGTTWSQQAYLKASNAEGADQFGFSVAVSGDTVVVGAYSEWGSGTGVNPADNNLAAGAGAAYVFVRTGTSWSQQAYLKASNTGAGDQFGYNVAVSDDTVVVGAPQEKGSGTGVNPADNNLASGAGAAYIFVRSGTSWSQQAYLKASNTGANDNFGISVAVSGHTVVIGALNEDGSGTGVNPADDNLATSAGAAYVFVRSGTTWSQQAYLKASNTGASDQFGAGFSVAVSGDTVVVGAPGESGSGTGVNPADNNLALGSGAAYVFVRSGTSWSQQAYLKASNTGAGDRFGGGVAVSGDTLVVGAINEDGNGTGVNPANNNLASAAGAAYVFVRSGTSWSQQAYLKASNTGAGDTFGFPVAVSGGTVVVSSIYEDGSGTGVNPANNDLAADAGAAYVFTGLGVPVNHAPTAVGDAAAIDEDTLVTLNVLGNDTDEDGDVLAVSAFTHGANGAVTLNPDGTLNYTPYLNFNGGDSFSYTVTDGALIAVGLVVVSVAPINDHPTAVGDAVTIDEDTSVTLNVLANDTDVDGDALLVQSVTQATNGLVILNPDGSVTYQPVPDFFGPDAFTYTLSDGHGGTATATVIVTVSPVNDPPLAVGDVAIALEDTSVNVPVLANDADPNGDTLTLAGFTQGANGTVILNPDGTLNYTPSLNFNGTDSFEYAVSDGVLTTAGVVVVLVAPVNDAPTAGGDSVTTGEDTPVTLNVLANDSDVEGDAILVQSVTQGVDGTVVINPDGSVTYSPGPNFHGGDAFTYAVSDGQGGMATATVLVTVTPVNDPPVATDSSATAGEDAATEIVLVASDVDGDALTFSIVTLPLHGTLSAVAGNRVIYTPAPNYFGPDSLTFRASDGPASDDGLVQITVASANDPAVLGPVSDQTVNEGTLLAFNLTATDLEGDTLTFSSPNLPPGATLNPLTGAFSWTPDFTQAGSYPVTFSVVDPSGMPDSKTITITVVDVPQDTNHDPDCSGARPSLGEIWPPNHKQVLQIGILGITDPDGDPVSVVITKILQDEPTNTLGDGSTWVDGSGVGTAQALVRAERSGTPRVPGNGRVYEIFFTVSDGMGGTCSSSVKVGVPHDQDHGPAIDDGVRYDSTVPGGPRVN